MATQIQIFERGSLQKGLVKKMRREGYIPCVIYVKGKSSEHGFIKKLDFDSVIRDMKPGFLPTMIFELKNEQGKTRKAIVKDIQYAVTTYDVLHLDFQELNEQDKVNVKVPIECTGVVDCVGIKAGGLLRYIMRHLKVRCHAKAIPNSFEVDVRNLDMRKVRRVSDVKMPEGVVALAHDNDILVTIVKR